MNAMEIVKEFEDLRLEAYQDQAGVWTIGYGHTGPEVREGLTITEDQAEEWLAEDMRVAFAAFDGTVKAPVNEKIRAACVSLIFNIGPGAWRSSTCLRRLNAGDYAGAAEALTWWNKVTIAGEKVVSRGLVRRRERERAIFMEGLAELGSEVVETGQATGGEHKPLPKSRTMSSALLGTLLSGGSSLAASIAGMDWRVAIAFLVVCGLFAYLGFNRWLEWKSGEH